MRAATYTRRGPAREVLTISEVPDPEPAAGEVRVRVEVSGVNPSDVKARAGMSIGMGGSAQPLPWPAQIPHQDGAGRIDRIGAGVAAQRMGERVWLYHAAFRTPRGTAAEYVCVPATQAVPLPDHVTPEQGAGLGIPYVTAHRCLLSDGPLEGATVLVTGGAGGVGHAAVQLARWAGARVVATTGSPDKARTALAAGASAVVDRFAPDVRTRLAAVAPAGFDRVVDVSLTANLPSYAGLLREHSTVAAYADVTATTSAEAWPLPAALRACNATIRFVRAYGLSEQMLTHARRDITSALHARALSLLPGPCFTLEEVAAAHEAVEAGSHGKVLVDLRR